VDEHVEEEEGVAQLVLDARLDLGRKIVAPPRQAAEAFDRYSTGALRSGIQGVD
jgi:hypothetical protein